MKNIVILISGRGSNMAAIIKETRDGILKDKCCIKSVFSNKPDAAGLQIAEENGIITCVIKSAKLKRSEYNAQLKEWLIEQNPDYIILAGYMLVIPKDIVDTFTDKIINIHPADTTQHQGLHAYEWAWENRLPQTKITVHYVDNGLDTGKIIAQRVVDLSGVKSLEEVESRGLKVEHEFYSKTLASIFTSHVSQLTSQEIAIIDFGGQYTHLIARRIRKLGIFSEIYQPEDFEIKDNFAGIIFSGGPQSVIADTAYKINLDPRTLEIPILGICYGHQLIAHLAGGNITSGDNPEYGHTEIECNVHNTIFSGTESFQSVWMSHGDQVTKMPADFIVTAKTDSVPIAAYESKNGMIMGVQFHPEVVHTQYGNKILDNFLSRCTDNRDWQVENYKDQLIEEVRTQAKDKDVLILLSGGVDSLVAMELCLAALGKERVFSIHVDTGFMRLNESRNIIDHLKELGYDQLRLIDAEERYLKELNGIVEPEAKRLVIGKLFVDIASEALAELKDKDLLLVQGTIYPDTIESGDSKKSAKIKTHHNRVGEIEQMIKEGKILEPIKDLYKDEVRELGIELGIPESLVNRHPFPGPGLAIRILGSDTNMPETGYDKEDEKLNQLLAELGLRGKILPVKSVGVMGDFRTYQHPAMIWFAGKMPDQLWKVLQRASSRIVNNLKTVNRVVFSLDTPQSDYVLKEHYLTKQACDDLRIVDDLLMRSTHNLKDIWQMPVVQLPLFDAKNGQIYLMRPVTSLDAMTANFYEMEIEFLGNLIKQARENTPAKNILYDITSKPPGTIEWE